MTLIGGSWHSAHAVEDPISLGALRALVTSVDPETIREERTQFWDAVASLHIGTEHFAEDEAARNLVQLHVWGDKRSIRLIWWESKSSNIRMFAVTCLMYQLGDATFAGESIRTLEESSRRFEEAEREARLAELTWFRSHYDAIYEVFNPLFEAVGPKRKALNEP